MEEHISDSFHLVLYSFGFKYGAPVDVNLLLDVRFLPNPYWDKELRPLSGCERPVAEFITGSTEGQAYLEVLKPFLLTTVTSCRAAGKGSLRVAVGCTGGRHRSVAIVEEIRSLFVEEKIIPVVFHRDMDRAV